ncbi:MAG: hypothetical protein QXP42_02645 [Candidatus Micrarchaeia archaeon]
MLVKQIKEKFLLKKPEEIYSLGMDLGEAMGIGLYKTHEYSAGRYTHFIIENNPFLRYVDCKKIKEPIDYFISGCMGGGGCFVHNAICQNIETSCKAKGDAKCDFLTGTEEELKRRGLWDEVCRRYKLEYIYPLQKEFVNRYEEGKEGELLEELIERVKDV